MKSEAAFNLSQFPLEIVAEILSRVPVKYILRLKSVSKFWFCLISSPQFIKLHLNLVANKEDSQRLLILDDLGYSEEDWGYKECPVTSLFVNSVTQAVDLDYYPFEDNSHAFYNQGSCNGLVLIAGNVVEYPILWNPTIRKYKNLSDFRPKWKQVPIYCNWIETSKWSIYGKWKQFPIYGFGYDELHDDYKVVAIVYHHDGDLDDDDDSRIDDSEIKVYSLKSDSWTSVDYSGESLFIKSSAGYYEETLKHPAVFVDGKLYWNSFSSDPNVPIATNIISFDLANEKWDKLEKPSFQVGESNWCVDRLGSDLCVCSDYKDTHLVVRVMKNYGVKTSWIRKFTIRYPTRGELDSPYHVPHEMMLDSPYFISNNGEMLFLIQCTFMIYNSKDDSFRFTNITNRGGNYDVIVFSQSLVSPFSTQGTENAEKREVEKSLDQNNLATINL